jgi:poly(3-hydroxyalkanoate) synthetase
LCPRARSRQAVVADRNYERAGTAAAFATREVAAAAVAESARRGYLDGRALAGMFAWMRPNDLIWNYVVNNYLLGKDPPAFDVLYWNQDTVRMAAGLHRDFIHLALDNSLTRPAGSRCSARRSTSEPSRWTATSPRGLNDHILPWESAYRTTQLLGGQSRFVLSTSGHIQAPVNPPAADRAESRTRYRLTGDAPSDPVAWAAQTDVRRGTWWPDYAQWLADHGGELRKAPAALGSRRHNAAAKAPGTYVHAG